MPLRSSMDPATKKFLDSETAKGGPELYDMSVQEARSAFARYGDLKVLKLPADIEDRTLQMGPKKVPVRITRPKGSGDDLPVVMYFHGGGWMLGDKDTYDRLIREIAVGSQAAVVFVEYSRSPEAKYPVAVEEAYAATLYIAEHGKEFKLDSSRLAVAGDSSGGNIAIIATFLAKERIRPKIRFQLLFYPVTDAAFTRPSYDKFTDGYFLSRKEVEYFWNNYMPDKQQRYSTKVSPLRASVKDLQGLPPTLLITAELDVLRDEGEAYARKLMEAYVPVTAVRFLGTVHGFVSVDQLRNTPPAESAISLANQALRKQMWT